MQCVWYQAIAGSAHVAGGREALARIELPLDRRLQGRSSWLRVTRERSGEAA